MSPARGGAYWADLTWQDFRALDHARTVAVLPVGAIEQHGPHLPLCVDTAINEGIMRKALALLPEDQHVLVLPTQAVGKSDEHLAYPGTLTLPYDVLTAAWFALGACVKRAGIERLVIFNAHGGQPQIAEIVARRLRVEHAMLVASCSWFRLGYPEGLFASDETQHGIHAGAIETAMMRHLHPDAVREALADNFPSAGRRLAEHGQRYVLPTGPVAFGWQAQDLHPSGACGDARVGDAEAGARLVQHAAHGLLDVLREVAAMPWPLTDEV